MNKMGSSSSRAREIYSNNRNERIGQQHKKAESGGAVSCPVSSNMIQRAIELVPSVYNTQLASYRMVHSSTPGGNGKKQIMRHDPNVLHQSNVCVMSTIHSNGTIVIVSTSGKVSKSHGHIERRLSRRIRRSSTSVSTDNLWIDYGDIDDMNLPLGWFTNDDINIEDSCRSLSSDIDDLTPVVTTSTSSSPASTTASSTLTLSTTYEDEKDENDLFDDLEYNWNEQGYFLDEVVEEARVFREQYCHVVTMVAHVLAQRPKKESHFTSKSNLLNVDYSRRLLCLSSPYTSSNSEQIMVAPSSLRRFLIQTWLFWYCGLNSVQQYATNNNVTSPSSASPSPLLLSYNSKKRKIVISKSSKSWWYKRLLALTCMAILVRSSTTLMTWWYKNCPQHQQQRHNSCTKLNLGSVHSMESHQTTNSSYRDPRVTPIHIEEGKIVAATSITPTTKAQSPPPPAVNDDTQTTRQRKKGLLGTIWKRIRQRNQMGETTKAQRKQRKKQENDNNDNGKITKLYNAYGWGTTRQEKSSSNIKNKDKSSKPKKRSNVEGRISKTKQK